MHNRETAIKQFADFMQRTNTDQFMDVPVKQRKSDAALKDRLKKFNVSFLKLNNKEDYGNLSVSAND